MCRPGRLIFAAVVLLGVTRPGPAAAPVPSAPGRSDGIVAAARKALDEVGDMNYQARTLTDLVNELKARLRVPVILDNQVFAFGLDPAQPVVNVNLRQVKLRDGLRAALAPLNLHFGLTQDGVVISTEEGVILRQMRQRVGVDCDGTDFASAMRQLAADTGANIVLDPRLGERAKKPVTLKLEDVPLETAVRLLAEVADLRAVRMNNVLYVTTGERARTLREDADGPTPPPPAGPFFPGGGDAVPLPVPGGPGGVPGGIEPGPGVVPPPPPPVQAVPAVPLRPAPVKEVEKIPGGVLPPPPPLPDKR